MSSSNSSSAFNTPNTESPQSPRRGLIGWIVRHPKSAAAGAFLLLLVGSCELLNMKAEHEFQRELDAIRASGAPVTLDDLNAVKCDVPDEENIALLIEAPAKAIAAYTLPEDRREITPVVGNGPKPPCGERMSAEQLAASEAYLADIAPHLAQVHEVLRHERGCCERHYTSPAIDGVLRKIYGPVRASPKALVLEAWLAAQAGDSENACQSVCDLNAYDQVLRNDNCLIAVLVRSAIRFLSLTAAADAVNLSGMDDAQLVRVTESLREPDWLQEMRRAIETERVIALDAAEWVFSGNKPVGDWKPLPFFVRFVPFVQPVSNTKGLRIMESYVSAFDLPESQILDRVRLTEFQSASLPSYCILWKMLTPSLSGAYKLNLRCLGSQRALIAALACERYRLANGEWPDSLDALVPTYLDAVPLDPFDAEPIRYKRIEQGIVLYSISEDETDNGGDVRRLEPYDPRKKPTDEGYVLLNPALRNREPAAASQPAETNDAAR